MLNAAIQTARSFTGQVGRNRLLSLSGRDRRHAQRRTANGAPRHLAVVDAVAERDRRVQAATDQTARARRWGPISPAATGFGATAVSLRSPTLFNVGVPRPQKYGAPMPPMGGAQLSPSE
jgi:hypothetical protein